MKTISEVLVENKRHGGIYFSAPGHKGRTEMYVKAGFGEFFRDVLKEDLSKLPGDYSYAKPSDSVKEVMDNYNDLYEAIHTELLFNGSNNGIMAAILACVPRGGKLIVSRDCHESAITAMRLGEIQPIYIQDEVKAACEENPDASAVLITSPDFMGRVPDIQLIADIVHNYRKILIVDQSTGAHLKFFDAVTGSRMAAEDWGADIVINGISNTLLSMNGTAILNICSDRVDVESVTDALNMFQHSEPNYVMLGSLDINEKIMRRWGGDMVISWANDLRYIYGRLEAIKGVSIIREENSDITKLNISLAELGVSGEQLEREFRNKGIFAEKVCGDYVLLLTGAGNFREDYMHLIKVVREITNNYAVGAHEERPESESPNFSMGVTNIPNKKELVPLYKSDGRVLYDSIITFPPGSPIACPGEIMNIEAITYIARAMERGDKVVGVDDEGQVLVGIE